MKEFFLKVAGLSALACLFYVLGIYMSLIMLNKRTVTIPDISRTTIVTPTGEERIGYIGHFAGEEFGGREIYIFIPAED